MACDICGKTGTSLVDLRAEYQTDDIKAICYDCERIVNNKNGKLLSMVLNIKSDLMKRFMWEKRSRKALR
jgi:hypothetical protein